MASTLTKPNEIITPWANSGNKRTISETSLIGITDGAASWPDGFPPQTMQSIASGGTWPSGLDMNGVIHAISSNVRFMNAGGQAKFNATLAAAIGGYPVGVVLQDTAGSKSYVNILDGNTTDFNTTPSSIGVSWILHQGKTTFSHGTSGWELSPSGLLNQWGQVSTNGSGDTAVTFPIPFQTAVYSLTMGVDRSGGGGVFATYSNLTLTGVGIGTWLSTTVRAGVTVHYQVSGK